MLRPNQNRRFLENELSLQQPNPRDPLSPSQTPIVLSSRRGWHDLKPRKPSFSRNGRNITARQWQRHARRNGGPIRSRDHGKGSGLASTVMIEAVARHSTNDHRSFLCFVDRAACAKCELQQVRDSSSGVRSRPALFGQEKFTLRS
jgi:hypothetical protein